MALSEQLQPATAVEANTSQPQDIPAPTSPPKETVAATTADSPLPTPIVTTPRAIIRPLHPQDAPSLALHANSPLISKYMSLAFPSPYTLEAAQTWINLNLTPPFTAYVIALSSSPSAVIGGIGFTIGKDVSSHTAELGYWIGTEFAGKGIMTEVLGAFIDWMFGEKGEIKRLCAQVFAPQKASMRCLEKCGFVAEGVMRGHVEKFGEVMDMHIFGLTKDDWEERKKRSQKK